MLNNKKIIIISVIIITILFLIYLIYKNNFNYSNEINLNEILQTEDTNKEINQINNIITNTIDATQNNEIIVHITGEVKKEGVIHLNKGDRIIDAIKKAGGETKQADLSQVNLAYELQDGQKIYIPNKNEKISEYIVGGNGNTNINSINSKEETKVNINTANQSELDSLPGIGPATAQKIIEYRNQNGNFKKIEDLQNVKGIGQAKYEEIRNNIEV